MKYRVLKNIFWLKEGEIKEFAEDGFPLPEVRESGEYLWIKADLYPEYFSPITEKEEQIEAAKKLLEGEGYTVSSNKKHITINPDLFKDLNCKINVDGPHIQGYCPYPKCDCEECD